MSKAPPSPSPPAEPVPANTFRGRFLRDPKLEAFARQYFAHGDRGRAYREAGYKGKRANELAGRLLKRPEVERRIAQMQREAENRTVADVTKTKDEVYQQLWETVRLADAKNDIAGRNKALELIGKTVAMFTDVMRREDPWEGKSRDEMILAVDAFLQDPVVRDLVRERIAQIDGRDPGGAAAPEAPGVPPVPEAAGVDPPQRH